MGAGQMAESRGAKPAEYVFMPYGGTPRPLATDGKIPHYTSQQVQHHLPASGTFSEAAAVADFDACVDAMEGQCPWGDRIVLPVQGGFFMKLNSGDTDSKLWEIYRDIHESRDLSTRFAKKQREDLSAVQYAPSSTNSLGGLVSQAVQSLGGFCQNAFARCADNVAYVTHLTTAFAGVCGQGFVEYEQDNVLAMPEDRSVRAPQPAPQSAQSLAFVA